MQANNTTSGSTSHKATIGSRLVFIFIGSIALFGNFLVVFLFIRRPQWLSKSHKRCILNLAITDILTALAVLSNPQFVTEGTFYEVSSQSSLSREIYCRIIWSRYLWFSLGVTSLYICVVLAFERWLAVRKPIFYKSQFKTWHMNALVVASWIGGFVFELPVTLMTEGVYDEQSEVCQWAKQLPIAMSIAIFFCEVIIPFGIILAAYVDIFRAIKASIRFAASARKENASSLARLRKVTRMTAIASFLLVVCWIPEQLRFLLSTLGVIAATAEYSHNNMITALAILVFANSSLNPFVYVFSNPEFRKAFKEIFCHLSSFRNRPLSIPE